MASDFDDIKRKLNIALFKSDLKPRLRLWRKLGKQLKDGIQIITALEELRNLAKAGSPMEAALTEWVKVMKNGKKVADAVKDWVSTEEAMILLAGEQAGDIAGAMDSLVKVKAASQNIKSAVISGLAYPGFLVLLSFGVMYMFSYKIIPAFANAVRGDRWYGMARLMIDTSNFAQHWLHWIFLAFVLAVIGIYVALPRWSGPGRVVLDRYPPFNVYRVMQGASWVIALAALIRAGVRLEAALEQLMKHAAPWGKVRIAAALRGLRAGKNLGDALLQSGYEFPDREIISDLRVYANKSGFDEALQLIGDEWLTESVERIKGLMGQVFGLTIMFAGGVIAFQVAGMLAMQLQMSQLIQTR